MSERELRIRKDWEFKSDFYNAIDAIAACGRIEALAPGLSGLVTLGAAIDGKTIYQPLREFDGILYDISCFLYGLEHWPAIREALQAKGAMKQVDLIGELALDKAMAGNFFYRLSELGVLNKAKSGRYNVLSLGDENITPDSLERGWPALFDKTRRLPMSELW